MPCCLTSRMAPSLSPLQFWPNMKSEMSSVFEKLPIKYFDLSFPDGNRSEEVAEKAKITFYDAVFIVLAEKLEVTLVTANPKHQSKFPGVKVVNLKDYR